MKRKVDGLRERLLAGTAPLGSRLEAYRTEVRTMIEQKERRLARQRRVTSGMWLFLVALCTVFLSLSGWSSGEIRLWWGIQACFWLLFGAVFLLRYFLDRNRLEFLKEIKALELRVAELAEKLDGRG
jgi:membrane protein YdbS with pleckstrin-like domain